MEPWVELQCISTMKWESEEERGMRVVGRVEWPGGMDGRAWRDGWNGRADT